MPTNGSYDKGTDSVMYMADINQELNAPIDLLFLATPSVPLSGAPWWVSKQSASEFILRPGLYDFGLSIYSTINIAATTSSGTRAVMKFNGLIDNDYRISLGRIAINWAIGTQVSGFLGGLIEFNADTVMAVQFNPFVGGDVSLASSSSTYIKFIRLS